METPRMWNHKIYIFALLASLPYMLTFSASTCKEREMVHVKLELAKQSIQNSISLHLESKDAPNDLNCSRNDQSLAYLNAAFELISQAGTVCRSCPDNDHPVPKTDIEEPDSEIEQPESKTNEPETETEEPELETEEPELETEKPELETEEPEPNTEEHQQKPRDCSDIYNPRNGVYKVWPRESGAAPNISFDVFCDMREDGGHWTVIQRRTYMWGRDKWTTDFDRDWDTYKEGFGNLEHQFWMGNEKLHILTKQANYTLKFVFVREGGGLKYATYRTFSVGDEESGYALSIGDYSGSAVDHLTELNGTKFSTYDRQNNGITDDFEACADEHHSGFWFNENCGEVNWNGVVNRKDKEGAFWSTGYKKEWMAWQMMKMKRTDRM